MSTLLERKNKNDQSLACQDLSEDQIKHIGVLPYFALLLVSVLFLLFFSLWTSPFYEHWYGCDCSFFTMVGRGITQGMVPYRDFFDLKGPYFFFIEALGQLIHQDRLGVFLIQIPFMCASLILVMKLSRLYLSKGKSVAVILIFLFGHISTIWGGNTLEEYMLPVNLLVIYIVVRHLKLHPLKSDSLPLYIPLITGVCFGIMLFAKITIAAPIMGVCMGIFVSLLAYKRYKELLYFVLYFILGVLIATIPIFIYFSYHDSLLTMLYCVFEFAFKRSIDFSDPFSIKWELKLTACFLGFITAILHMPLSEVFQRKAIESKTHDKPAPDHIRAEQKKYPTEEYERNAEYNREPEYSIKYALGRAERWLKRKNTEKNAPVMSIELCLMLIFMSLFTYILLHLGNPWIYYFITAEPVLVLACIMLFYMYDPLILFSSVREGICLLTLGVYIFYFGSCSMDTIQTFIYDHDNQYYAEYYKDAQDIAVFIPEMERDSVFSFDIDMTFFEAVRIMPCYKYQINLQFFIALEPSIQDEIMEYFDKTPPKWMIISETLDQYLPDIYNMMMEKYHCLYFNSAGCLYILND